MSPTEVLKVTSCAATNALFKRLQKRDTTPGALPTILQSYGPVARDGAGFLYTGWLVERLFEPTDIASARTARALGRQKIGAYKPEYLTKLQNTVAAWAADELLQALKEEQEVNQDVADWRVSERIALNMAQRTTGGLREAFLFLLTFVRAERCSLDLLTQGNILCNMFGEPVLGDPVCPSDGMPELPLNATNTLDEAAHCVIAHIPIKVEGLDVVTHPYSSANIEYQEAKHILEDLSKMGITADITSYGSPTHTAHLNGTFGSQKIWSLPNLMSNLRAGKYLSALNA